MKVKPVIHKPFITVKKDTPKGISRKKISANVRMASYDSKEKMTNYLVYTAKDDLVGLVSLVDRNNGVWVDYIENYYPKKYSNFGAIADQIEVEHCLKRKLTTFSILSRATTFSLPFHYNRGKRFRTISDTRDKAFLKEKYGTQNMNTIMENLLKIFKPQEIHEEIELADIPMYMPKSLIEKYIQVINKYPLLKKIV
jgi:hypothetical protein